MFLWSPDFPPPHPFEHCGGGHPANWQEQELSRMLAAVNKNRLSLMNISPFIGDYLTGKTMAIISVSAAKPIDRAKTINRLRTIARVMDTAIKIPGTKFRFGADSIIGLVPGAGDLTTMGISIYVLAEAYRLGLPRNLLLKMAGNIAIDTGIGAIPLVGDIFDMFFKSNTKNLSLVLEWIERSGEIKSYG